MKTPYPQTAWVYYNKSALKPEALLPIEQELINSGRHIQVHRGRRYVHVLLPLDKEGKTVSAPHFGKPDVTVSYGELMHYLLQIVNREIRMEMLKQFYRKQYLIFNRNKMESYWECNDYWLWSILSSNNSIFTPKEAIKIYNDLGFVPLAGYPLTRKESK